MDWDNALVEALFAFGQYHALQISQTDWDNAFPSSILPIPIVVCLDMLANMRLLDSSDAGYTPQRRRLPLDYLTFGIGCSPYWGYNSLVWIILCSPPPSIFLPNSNLNSNFNSNYNYNYNYNTNSNSNSNSNYNSSTTSISIPTQLHLHLNLHLPFQLNLQLHFRLSKIAATWSTWLDLIPSTSSLPLTPSTSTLLLSTIIALNLSLC